MSALIVDGKAMAENIYAALMPRLAAHEGGATLGIVVVGKDPVIESFVRIKTRAAERLGVQMVRTDLSEKASEEEILAAIRAIEQKTSAVIVQLPLPQGSTVDTILAAVPNEKDVDALNPNIGEADRLVHAPVALAVVEILQRSGVEIRGAHAAVVGLGRLVGAPTAWLLGKLGAEVSTISLNRGTMEDLKHADIVVLGAGNPGFIKPEHLKEGVALIDAGTSEQSGKVVGDADPACATKASVFTPVPGGVGPVAVAMIFKNLLDLLEAAH